VHKRIRTPFGSLHIAASEKGISALSLDNPNLSPPRRRGPNYKLDSRLRGNDNGMALKWIRTAESSLRRYFKGDSRAVRRIPLDIKGTVFQKKVWQALKQIPAGKTRSYAAIAKCIGHPKAFRAVGTACGANPVALVIPCHRAVGSGQSLGGFAWGIQKKKKLLRLENLP